MEDTKLIFFDTKNPEIVRAFSEVNPNDFSMRNEAYGESLQYLGTVIKAKAGLTLTKESLPLIHYTVHHEFRHRAVPGTNERKYWKINATVNFIVGLDLSKLLD